MLPADLDPPKLLAIALIFGCWGLYGVILSAIGKGSLNSRLYVARKRWMGVMQSEPRENRVFDAILLGHISSSVSFFGSATLLVLAALVGTLANARALHIVAMEHKFLGEMSVGLFALYLFVVTAILAGCFFSFVYALRKLAYTFALIGGLGAAVEHSEESRIMISSTATVLTEAIKSLNNGIRGYYFAIAALFLFTGPYVCMGVTLGLTSLLFYRQLISKTARAIDDYVGAVERIRP
jgi:uncharacterized membrane protein